LAGKTLCCLLGFLKYWTGDAMTKVEEYHARAHECELRADQVHDPEAKQQFLELARQSRHIGRPMG